MPAARRGGFSVIAHRAPRVLALAGDAGGAAALAPVLRLLAHDATVGLQAFAYREAPAVWRDAGFHFGAIPNTADDAWLVARLAEASLLLVATSVNGIDWERRAIALARQAKLPAIAVLDFWSNYSRRFENASGQPCLPDRICVMDELARDEMRAAGFPSECLVVTGQPAFDALQERRETFGDARRAELRLAAGVKADELLVLYASQPFADLYGGLDRVRTAQGYDEIQVHGLCAAALARLAERHDRKLTMAIRRHPRESGALPEAPRTGLFRTIASREPDRLDAVLAADLVLGMNSMLLMEAVLLGRIVVSVQPGLRTADALPSNRDGRSVAVTAADTLDAALEGALFDATWRRQQLLNLSQQTVARDAAGKVAALVHQSTAGRHSRP